jgi:putative serine protease PepD
MSSPGPGSTTQWSVAMPPDDPYPETEAAPVPAPARRPSRVLIVGAVVVILVLTAIVFYQWGSSGTTPVALPTPRPSPTASAAPTTAKIYDALAPSVVSIDALAAGGTTVRDSGTGVVVNGDGTILTALHVVRDAGSIRLTFADGSRSTATVTATDPASDIATLAPDPLPSVVVPAVLGRADRLAVGDPVIAIGDPLGLARTTTTGVVSGLDRGITDPDGAQLSGLIQFDAAVNPGSSGGPLLNAKGETVGIVVALANPTAAGTFIGIGFAVPIATAATAPGGAPVPQ